VSATIETDLIARARAGEAAAWETLVHDHQERVYRLVYLIMADPYEAQDVAQETFLRAYQHLELSRLPGETTLAAAEAYLEIPIRLPAYPPDLGAPDRVFLLRDFGGTLILAWSDPNYPDLARLALFAIPPGPIVNKLFPEQIERASVAGREAIWATGDHYVEVLLEGRSTLALVHGHVLIWEVEGVTYRLETALPLEEAIRIAESIGEAGPSDPVPVTAEPVP
jgi:hypothetical protein